MSEKETNIYLENFKLLNELKLDENFRIYNKILYTNMIFISSNVVFLIMYKRIIYLLSLQLRLSNFFIEIKVSLLFDFH